MLAWVVANRLKVDPLKLPPLPPQPPPPPEQKVKCYNEFISFDNQSGEGLAATRTGSLDAIPAGMRSEPHIPGGFQRAATSMNCRESPKCFLCKQQQRPRENTLARRNSNANKNREKCEPPAQKCEHTAPAECQTDSRVFFVLFFFLDSVARQESNALTAGDGWSHGASESREVLAKPLGIAVGTVCRLL